MDLASTQPRIALFGGTFDPIHNAHLEIARAAADRFHLEKILFIPAANPPHKTDRAQAPFEDRVRMAELACAGEPRFEVSRIEEGTKRSYSILTIEKLRKPGDPPVAFLIGADAFAEIETWHRWRDVIAQVVFIVVTRPGFVYRVPPGAAVHELKGLALHVSSSEIRAALAGGRTGLPIPESVMEYIRSHRLYG
ncbi:MAG: nicotinate-nucleotide adenylyltransferase [Acidobacteriota bacterium]|nr:nicotinate-nucleotide adenylyltransferase [Acidobacteriota bacterium]